MSPPKNIAADVDRLGRYLGLPERWSYFDVHARADAASALQRWALLRQLHEQQQALPPAGMDAA